MKIRSICLSLVSLVCTSLLAEEPFQKETTPDVHLRTPYVSLGIGPAPFPLPIFGLGYRAQHNHHGFNTSFNFIALPDLFIAGKGSALYDYYFNPNKVSQLYLGMGPAIIGGGSSYMGEIFGGAEFVVGKQYLNETGASRFFEVSIDIPFIDFKRAHSCYPIPLVLFTYGIGF